MYLNKAREFLLGSEFLDEDEFTHAGISLACLSGIASASCILRLKIGPIHWGSNHREAITLLRRAGFPDESKILAWLIDEKNPAQYHPKRTNATHRAIALDKATKLYELATEVHGRAS